MHINLQLLFCSFIYLIHFGTWSHIFFFLTPPLHLFPWECIPRIIHFLLFSTPVKFPNKTGNFPSISSPLSLPLIPRRPAHPSLLPSLPSLPAHHRGKADFPSSLPFGLIWTSLTSLIPFFSLPSSPLFPITCWPSPSLPARHQGNADFPFFHVSLRGRVL